MVKKWQMVIDVAVCSGAKIEFASETPTPKVTACAETNNLHDQSRTRHGDR
jgi:hypothetical protein